MDLIFHGFSGIPRSSDVIRDPHQPPEFGNQNGTKQLTSPLHNHIGYTTTWINYCLTIQTKPNIINPRYILGSPHGGKHHYDQSPDAMLFEIWASHMPIQWDAYLEIQCHFCMIQYLYSWDRKKGAHKQVEISYLSLSNGTEPKSTSHTGQHSNSSSEIFLCMHFLQTGKNPKEETIKLKSLELRVLSQKWIQISCHVQKT